MKGFSREEIEAEMALRFLVRAIPPPILFRYRGPSDWAIDEISKQQLYAAYPEELNDPFECCAPIIWNVDLLRRLWVEGFARLHGVSTIDAETEFQSSFKWEVEKLLERWKTTMAQTGIVCFSAIPNSIRMWAYYAQAHQGICIGYDTRVRPFNVALEVKYKNPETAFDVVAAIENDPTEIAANITFRKSEEWEFEAEYRIASNLGGIRQIPFEASAIKEIRFGARIKTEFKEKVMDAVSHLPQRPTLIQMGCDFDRFILTESAI
jgi:hypothetical protein